MILYIPPAVEEAYGNIPQRPVYPRIYHLYTLTGHDLYIIVIYTMSKYFDEVYITAIYTMHLHFSTVPW